MTVIQVMQGINSSGVGTSTMMAAPAPRSGRTPRCLELHQRGGPVHTTRPTTPSSDAMIDKSPTASPLLADQHLLLDQPTTPTSASSDSSAFSSASSIARRVNNLQIMGDIIYYYQFNMQHSQAGSSYINCPRSVQQSSGSGKKRAAEPDGNERKQRPHRFQGRSNTRSAAHRGGQRVDLREWVQRQTMPELIALGLTVPPLQTGDLNETFTPQETNLLHEGLDDFTKFCYSNGSYNGNLPREGQFIAQMGYCRILGIF